MREPHSRWPFGVGRKIRPREDLFEALRVSLNFGRRIPEEKLRVTAVDLSLNHPSFDRTVPDPLKLLTCRHDGLKLEKERVAPCVVRDPV